MKKTTFNIPKMDCASEESMVRMKLGGMHEIKSLEFDLEKRKLEVYHEGDPQPIFHALDSLKLDARLVVTQETDEVIEAMISPAKEAQERRLLWQVLAINLFFFILEMATGFIANSMGLIADSLDMLADTLVYGLALFAVGGTVTRKKSIAKASGYFQLVLAIFGFAEVVRRFLGFGEVPSFSMMIIISLLALIGNAICLYLLQRSRSKDAHMQASMIFTSNDVIVNLGVIAAGILVYFTSSRYPDLVIGTFVFLIVGRGAFRILQLSK